ncbi:unnamed protein product, partial [Rotaria sp. Silwood2]
MERAISEFCTKIIDNDCTLMYFSGHGMEAEGINYLLPIEPRYDPTSNCIDLNAVLKGLNNCGKNLLNIIILDACRADKNNDTWKGKAINQQESSKPAFGKAFTSNVRIPVDSQFAIIFSSDSGTVSFANYISIPLRSGGIDFNAKWKQNGVIVAGKNELGTGPNHLSLPVGLYVDEYKNVYVADWFNSRIVKWEFEKESSRWMAGGNGKGNKDNQLYFPTDMIVDRKRDCLFICDTGNKRLVQWPLRGIQSGKTIIPELMSYGLTMDEKGFLYICDYEKHEVVRWQVGETQKTVVAGGNGQGDGPDQLNCPISVFLDRKQSVYVSDYGNHRIVKWAKDAKTGIRVAGSENSGNTRSQLSKPRSIAVDQHGTIMIADAGNHRIVAWLEGAKEG